MKKPRKLQRGNKSDYTLAEKQSHDLKRLKRENAKMRKLISKVDLTRYENLQQLVAQQREEDKLEKAEKRKELEKWRCHDCGKGHLQLKIFDRRDAVYYYRSCNICYHHTNMKKYNSKVEGS